MSNICSNVFNLTFWSIGTTMRTDGMVSKLVPFWMPGDISPFWTGAICSNLAWLTVWPLEPHSAIHAM